MKKKIKIVLILVVAFLIGHIIADTCKARWRPFRRISRSVSRIGTVLSPQAWHDANDQGKCEIEAQYMHDHNIHGHVFGLIGIFEGCGWGGTNCTTCTPRRRMTLTGDAQVGRFRVRSWR